MGSDLNVETALLAAIFRDGDILFEVVDRVLPPDFESPMHGLIFEALRDRVLDELPTDLVSVIADLRTREKFETLGGEGKARGILEDRNFDPGAASHYGDLIAQASKRRRISSLAGKLEEQAGQGGDLAALGTALGSAITELAHGKEHFVSDIATSANEVRVRLLALASGELKVDRVKTGFKDLDRLIKGLRSGQLVVIGARPGMGKTAFGLEIARRVATEEHKRVIFFSLEMSVEELSERVVAAQAEINFSQVQSGELSAEELDRVNDAVMGLAGVDLVWNSDPTVHVADIRTAVLRTRAMGNLGMIIVDYLQLMSSGKARSIESRQAEVAEISRGLKILARELEIPVIALSQLSRSLENRHDKRPQLSDLRDSGQIEQDADLVLFLHREEMYDENTPDKGLVEVIVAKHRNGPVGKVSLWFDPALMRFGDLVDPAELIASSRVVFDRDIQFDASKERAEAAGDLWT